MTHHINKMLHTTAPLLLILLITLHYISSFNVSSAQNPFTPKAYVIRYWNKQITNNLPQPSFLLDKASPLNASDFASFSRLTTLSGRLAEFCQAANLLCFPELSPGLLERRDRDNSNFTAYSNQNFTNYGTDRAGGLDAFGGYSVGDNVVADTFQRYSRDATGHEETFDSYATESNVVDQSFAGYGTTATGGGGEFNNYNERVNVPNLKFTSYSDSSNGRTQAFSGYLSDGNSGDERFASYGKNGNGADNEFAGYGRDSNVIGSTFANYGETGNGANDTFTSYGAQTNVPETTFRNYGDGANAASDTFENYRNDSNVGDDSFQSYGKESNAAELEFANYGQSFNEGTDKFTSYGKDATDPTVEFKIYGVNNTFKEYAKEGVKFTTYHNDTSSSMGASLAAKGKKVGSKWVVEPGKFFREVNLKSGSIMPMPDIRDKMPRRSFLPRVIVSKLPFSTSKLNELKSIFHAGDDSSMATMLHDSLAECERAPSPGETKRCVGSIEDMIDFSTLVLGRNVTVRTTESTKGYSGKIMIGDVRGINGGEVTKSVSCHQSLFPYLLYYCHSVPKVRVYEADILDPKSRDKINRGVAICHLDTSSWSPGHGAFIALGSGPGKIEVCHWIFQNDMTWTIAD